jgi:hypothetical protein
MARLRRWARSESDGNFVSNITSKVGVHNIAKEDRVFASR